MMKTLRLLIANYQDFGGYQKRAVQWCVAAFGTEIANDKIERTHRFGEESLEALQSLGTTKIEVLQLVDYVFSRPVGDPKQEVGGVMCTLANMCNANDIDLAQVAEAELARCWVKIEKIRAKHWTKPKIGPLPGIGPDEADKHEGQVIELAMHLDNHLHANRAHRVTPSILGDALRKAGYRLVKDHTK